MGWLDLLLSSSTNWLFLLPCDEFHTRFNCIQVSTASHIISKMNLFTKNWEKLWARAKCHLDMRKAKMCCNRSPWLWRNRHNHPLLIFGRVAKGGVEKLEANQPFQWTIWNLQNWKIVELDQLASLITYVLLWLLNLEFGYCRIEKRYVKLVWVWEEKYKNWKKTNVSYLTLNFMQFCANVS